MGVGTQCAHDIDGAFNPHGVREVLLAEPALKDFPEDEQGKEWSVEIYLCLCKHWYIYLSLWLKHTHTHIHTHTRSMSLTKLSIVHTKFNVTQLNFPRPFLFAQLKLHAHWTTTLFPPPLSICIYFQLYCLSLQLPRRSTHLKAVWRTASSLQHQRAGLERFHVMVRSSKTLQITLRKFDWSGTKGSQWYFFCV